MLTVFNRQELITVLSQEKLFRVRDALSAAGIASYTKVHGTAQTGGRGHSGTASLRQDALYTYTIYVRKDDYDRAARAIQPALRNDLLK